MVLDDLLKWLESYIGERKQQVFVNSTLSDVGDLHAGVPHGSLLGPLLFLVYINDITIQ